MKAGSLRHEVCGRDRASIMIRPGELARDAGHSALIGASAARRKYSRHAQHAAYGRLHVVRASRVLAPDVRDWGEHALPSTRENGAHPHQADEVARARPRDLATSVVIHPHRFV